MRDAASSFIIIISTNNVVLSQVQMEPKSVGCVVTLVLCAGVVKSWEPHPRLPRCSLRTLLSRFLDVTTPPTPQFLQWLSTWASDEEDQKNLRHLATVNIFTKI